MKLKDLIFLTIALIAWIYSSYRSFKKQAAQKRGEEGKRQPVWQQEEIPDPAPNPFPSEGRSMARDQRKPVVISIPRPSPSGSLEILTTDIKATSVSNSKKALVEKKERIEKQISSSLESEFKLANPNDLVDEIRNEKTDWKKAIVLSEILRPVYF